MKRAIWRILLFTMSLSILLLGCSSCANPVKSIDIQGSLSVRYETISEMIRDSDAIIIVDVISNETMIYLDVPFTISDVTIDDVILGNSLANQRIKIIETGGYITQNGQTFDMRFGGVSVMRPTEQLLLFIKEFEGPQIAGAYIPIGAFQGKFVIRKNAVMQQATSEYHLEEAFPSNKTEFIQYINDKAK